MPACLKGPETADGERKLRQSKILRPIAAGCPTNDSGRRDERRSMAADINDKWKMYDELISGIPEGIKIREVVIGIHWTTVLTDELCGMAGTVTAGFRTGIENGLYTGMDLKEAAQRAKSWNFLEASVGMAAINTWYNSLDKMKELGLYSDDGSNFAGQGDSVFSHPEETMKGKKVTVVGHFPYIERKLGDICDLTILERMPRDGYDLPDPACEYILGDQDYVYITGMTFTNKTLPRLLELTRNAQTVLVGPSVPITPLIFKYGVDHISGFYITEPETNRQIIAQSGRFQTFKTGVRVEYGRN